MGIFKGFPINFIKKVGNIVGIRKGSSIEYSIKKTPLNPKTPSQQLNRVLFGHISTGAVAGMGFNQDLGGFISDSKDLLRDRELWASRRMYGVPEDVYYVPVWNTYPKGSESREFDQVFIYEDGVQFLNETGRMSRGTGIKVLIVWTDKETSQMKFHIGHIFWAQVEYDTYIEVDLSSAEPDSPVGIYGFSDTDENPEEKFYVVEPTVVEWG